MGGFLSVVISAMAVWMDLREEAVDNSWVLFSIMAGFLLQLLEKGPKGMIIFLTGAAVPLILLGILFIFRMLGAGDVKILCALGESWVHGQLQNVSFIHCLQVQAFLWQFLFLQAVSADDSFIYISI